jgi:hypothetical protein
MFLCHYLTWRWLRDTWAWAEQHYCYSTSLFLYSRQCDMYSPHFSQAFLGVFRVSTFKLERTAKAFLMFAIAKPSSSCFFWYLIHRIIFRICSDILRLFIGLPLLSGALSKHHISTSSLGFFYETWAMQTIWHTVCACSNYLRLTMLHFIQHWLTMIRN